MLWSQVLAPQVHPVSRSRGRDYFERGRVVRLAGDARAVTAQVRGSRLYDVTLALQDNGLSVQCDCPAFGPGTCKHVWATLLEAERQGRLGAPGLPPAVVPRRGAPAGGGQPMRPLPLWRDRLETIGRVRDVLELPAPAAALQRPDEELRFVVDLSTAQVDATLRIETQLVRRRRDGQWGEPRPHPMTLERVEALPDAVDARVLALLHGARPYGLAGYGVSSYQVAVAAAPLILDSLAVTGRARVRLRSEGEAVPLRWQPQPVARLVLCVVPRDEEYVLVAVLVVGQERRPLESAALLLRGGLAFFPDGTGSLFDHRGLWPFVPDLRRHRELCVPQRHAGRLLAVLAGFGPEALAAVELPEELRIEVVRAAPRPRLHVEKDRYDPRRLLARLGFDYDAGAADALGSDRPPADLEEKPFHFDAETRRLVLRDANAEEQAREHLFRLGLRRSGEGFAVPPRRLDEVVRALVPAGFQVEVDGRLHRPGGRLSLKVSSGIDWFDLEAEVDFGGVSAKLPALLEAARRGETTVALDDGSHGLLPEEWLRRQGFLSTLGAAEDGRLRFRPAQAMLVGALLEGVPDVAADAGFGEARARLRSFSEVRPADAPEGFRGTLRPYQREGLGWLHFLREFSLGGCLADDMGLGKTVQVLALLASRRGVARHPSLAVVPRSLIFNWKEEAARFTPELRILDHTGLDRSREPEPLAAVDLVLTTYGTLRRDAALLGAMHFDYLILDEAQNVKNHRTESARAVRRLAADHRVALSGTPLENHVGELKSLLDFLNPGLLGSSSAFAGGDLPADETVRRALAEGIRPFVLRRTKQQVEKDLPPKNEQTLYCELEGRPLALYRELAAHYRRTLLAQVDQRGMARSKILVLEALLRLRQAACHPGLVDKRHADLASAKIETLLPLLREVIEEGHKALVFSQFTSFLAILRARLEREGIVHEYLDGRTRDRAARVRRFQDDAACPLFLVSLKAGGTGLNLTAADYVFLLDPWWNPAVEAQAIDRAHRIGQQRHVFAYRLIAKDTVEEKVLALQQGKRELFDAILGEKLSLIRSLRREDLEHLLS